MTIKKVNPKAAFGDMKVQLQLLSPIAEIYTALVLQGKPGRGGAADYGIYNWRGTQIKYTTYLGAIRRHTLALEAGQDIDPKSELPHEAHITASAFILMDARACGMLIDDRPMFGDAALALLDPPPSYDKRRAKAKPAPVMTREQFAALSTGLAGRVARAYKARAGLA